MCLNINLGSCTYIYSVVTLKPPQNTLNPLSWKNRSESRALIENINLLFWKWRNIFLRCRSFISSGFWAAACTKTLIFSPLRSCGNTALLSGYEGKHFHAISSLESSSSRQRNLQSHKQCAQFLSNKALRQKYKFS